MLPLLTPALLHALPRRPESAAARRQTSPPPRPGRRWASRVRRESGRRGNVVLNLRPLLLWRWVRGQTAACQRSCGRLRSRSAASVKLCADWCAWCVRVSFLVGARHGAAWWLCCPMNLPAFHSFNLHALNSLLLVLQSSCSCLVGTVCCAHGEKRLALHEGCTGQAAQKYRV